ncbi:hypothetical protein ACFOYW_06065 [Gryllotalpicola reticulitermitis]|uniref:Uncharacterized protein n=1 Tax=Gryllotalpicola reticulitermitis TaxID=1184153 RepID=A0ABV8Q544_9MICO
MKTFIEALCWFVVGVILWMTTVTTVTRTELVIAGLTSAACALLAVAARRVAGLRLRPSWAWLRWLALVPVQAGLDTGRLAVWLLHGAHETADGESVTRRKTSSGRSPTSVATRAAAIGVVSAAPGSLVLDADEDGHFLLHRLVSGWPSLDEKVSR